jgi:hypothetical protein
VTSWGGSIIALGLIAFASLVGELTYMWSSCAFWHSGGALWSGLASGFLAGLAGYVPRRSYVAGSITGVVGGGIAFVGVTIIALGHCAA